MEILSERGDMITSAEQAVLTDVFNLLDELEPSLQEHTSAASELARMWAGFYEDTWVWGGMSSKIARTPTKLSSTNIFVLSTVTPRIGWILRELGNAYEAARKAGPSRR